MSLNIFIQAFRTQKALVPSIKENNTAATAAAEREVAAQAKEKNPFSSLPADILRNVLAYLPSKDALAFSQSDKYTKTQTDLYIQDSGLTDVTASKQDKLNFINQFKSTEEVNKTLSSMHGIGFSKEQTIKMKPEEITQIQTDYMFTAAVLRTMTEKHEASFPEIKKIALTQQEPWSDDKNKKLTNIIKAINKIQAEKKRPENRLHLPGLYLTSGDLAALMPKIKEIDTLEVLNLNCNQLTHLPDIIGNLTKLGWLFLSDNHLTSLPDSIGTLTNLKELWLDKNQLTSLPDSLRYLTNLKTLYLSNNQLTSLPDSLRYLTDLEELLLDNNQLPAFPA